MGIVMVLALVIWAQEILALALQILHQTIMRSHVVDKLLYQSEIHRKFSVAILTMKKAVALILAVDALFLAGCCTTYHATQWEYKNLTLQAYHLRPQI